MDYCCWINKKLDVFFNKEGERYLDMNIYKEIFDFMDNSDFKKEEPEKYEAELFRIGDLHNSFAYAFEKGEIKGHEKEKIERMIEEKIETAKIGLREGYPIEMISKMTGLTEKEINELKE